MKFVKTIARQALSRAGYGLIRLDRQPQAPTSIDHGDAQEAIHRARRFSMVSEAGLLSLWDQVRFCEATGLPGALVECGVWKGGACALMAMANFRYGERRRNIHLFDAFTDICQPDPALDGERAIKEVEEWARIPRQEITGALRPMSGFYDHKGGAGRMEDVQKLLENEIGYPREYLHYHEGWFQETIPQVSSKIGPIAVLRLDGDYYASTKTCLDHLAHQVVPGGFIIFDDYGAYEGCRRAVDEYIDSTRPTFLHRATKNVHYLVIPSTPSPPGPH